MNIIHNNLKSALSPLVLAIVSTCFALSSIGVSPVDAVETAKESGKTLVFNEQGQKFLLPPPEFSLPGVRDKSKNASGVSFTTLSGVPTTAPTNFRATGQNSQVTLSWDSVAGATGYNLWRDSGSGYTYFTTVSTLNYVDNYLNNGFTYAYAINAVNTSGPSTIFAFVNGTPIGLTSSPTSVAYTSFQGENLTRYVWPGANIAVLTSSGTLDTGVMDKMVTAFDAGYIYYETSTGRKPSLFRNVNGKATIAEVASTCGAGCGYVGFTGIEIRTDYFNPLYNQVKNDNLYDHIIFYELGRNFWFYRDKIEYKGSDDTGLVGTGYALYMRFKAMESAGVQGAPFLGVAFNDYKANTRALVDLYEADPTLTWSNTLRVDGAPRNLTNLNGTHLFASFCMRLERDYGGANFVNKLWKEVDKQPNATTTTEALNNFVRAASIAAGQDLTSLFQDTWRWPLTLRPTAVNDSFTVNQNSSANSLNVLANDSNSNPSQSLTIQAITQPTNGTVTLANGNVVYTPNFGYFGADSFAYTISNGTTTANATVTLTVTALPSTNNGLGTPYAGTSASISAIIEAENFNLGGQGVGFSDTSTQNYGGSYRNEAVDIDYTTSANNNNYVGWTEAGEWLHYTVNISTSGNYDLTLRVASAFSGKTMHLEVDGVNVSGAIAVPNTGGWLNWQNVVVRGVALQSGTKVIKVVMDTGGLNLDFFRFATASTTPVPNSGTPFSGAAISLPGQVQAEDFNSGGEGVAYHDTTSSNIDGQYRNEAVDIDRSNDVGGGHFVSWIGNGEWLNYTVNVQQAGSYTFAARVATPLSGKTFHVEMNGVDKTGPIAVPNTGSWLNWQTVTIPNISLSDGAQVMRIVMDTGPFNLNYVEFSTPVTTPSSPNGTPYGGSVRSISNVIEAEDFNLGGQGVGFSDTSTQNYGNSYRNEAVDIDYTTGASNNNYVGWTDAGEWMKYAINVPTTGNHNLTLRVASPFSGKTMHLEVDGVDVTGNIAIPNTGGWLNWQNVVVPNIALNSGARTLKVILDSGSFNLDKMQFNAVAAN